ncbi:MAG: hypothetical protein GDA45_06370 [Chromatiales bacterium]|nr:hypothetical protein [Chromatiales bacterium]
MKRNPFVYILAIGFSIVVLLILIADSSDDHLLPTPNGVASAQSAPDYLAADSDNPSEAVKAVGSQINQLRAEQSAFKADMNQTVEQLHRELRTLNSAITKLNNRPSTNPYPTDGRPSNLSSETTRQPLNPTTRGSEPIAPYYEEPPKVTPPTTQKPPAWLWIEDLSASTYDFNNQSDTLTNEGLEYLNIDSLQTIPVTDNVRDDTSLIIPPATIIRGVTLTAAIGRLPVRGQLNEPWPIKVISTMEGYAANGYTVDAAQMIWDGKAFGDANFECVRVVLTRVTSVLPSAVVSYVEASDTDKGLGYLSDSYGQPCLKGKLVSNAAKQMTAEAILGIAQGIGEGYADTQRTRTVSPEGNTVESITGEEVRVLIGQGFAKSVGNVRNYLASRYDVWDAIYVPPEQQVVINVDQPLEFIYDPGQKLYDSSMFAFKVGNDTGSSRLD